MPELQEQQNITDIVQYPGTLELFNYHYPDNPVLPAAVLLAEWLNKLSASFPEASFSLSNIDFREFILPNQSYIFKEKPCQHKYRWLLFRDEKVCVSTDWCLSKTQKSSRWIDADIFYGQCGDIAESTAESLCLPTGFRNRQFSFIDRYQIQDNTYTAVINTADLLKQFTYLQNIINPALFMALEAAGNLALMCLRDVDKDMFITADHVINRFIFCKFAAIDYYSVKATEQLYIKTTARPVSRYLVWSANIFTSHGDCLLSVDKAVSVRRG